MYEKEWMGINDIYEKSLPGCMPRCLFSRVNIGE